MEYYTKSADVQVTVWGEEGHRGTWGIPIPTKALRISDAVASCRELAAVQGHLSFSSRSEMVLSIPVLKEGLPFSLRSCSYRLRL